MQEKQKSKRRGHTAAELTEVWDRWGREHFGVCGNIVGQQIRLNGVGHTAIGVMDPPCRLLSPVCRSSVSESQSCSSPLGGAGVISLPLYGSPCEICAASNRSPL